MTWRLMSAMPIPATHTIQLTRNFRFLIQMAYYDVASHTRLALGLGAVSAAQGGAVQLDPMLTWG